MGVTSPLWRRGSCTGPMAADCQPDVKQYLFSSGITDKEKGGRRRKGRGLYNSKQEQIISSSKQ